MNRIIPFPYAVPDKYVLKTVPEKTRVFAELVPGTKADHKFGQGEQEAYYKYYQTSRFARTKKKGGWDCLRHYEILMNGCIPIFEDLEKCPRTTMVTFPKALVQEATVALLPWEETSERIQLYNSYVLKLLDHTRTYCTISALTYRFISNMPCLLTNKVPDPSKQVLMINGEPGVNYSRDLLSIGLREFYGANFVEYPRNDILYRDCTTEGAHGNGFTYSGHLDHSIVIDRTKLEERINYCEFDAILYGKMGADEGVEGHYTTMPMFPDVQHNYTPNEIAFLYGGDGCQSLVYHWHKYMIHLGSHENRGICFVRELEDSRIHESLWKVCHP